MASRKSRSWEISSRVPGIGLEPGLEPDHGVQVQVVGGLVQQQQVGAAHQGTGQVQAHAPAPGVAVHRPSLLAGRKAQAVQQPGGAALGAVAVDGLQAPVQLGLAQTVVGRFGGGQLCLHAAQLPVAVHDEIDGGVLAARRLLGHVGDLPTGGKDAVPRVRVQLPPDECEQAGFAASVRTHHAHLLPGIDGRVRAFQEQVGAAAQAQVAKLEHIKLNP